MFIHWTCFRLLPFFLGQHEVSPFFGGLLDLLVRIETGVFKSLFRARGWQLVWEALNKGALNGGPTIPRNFIPFGGFQNSGALLHRPQNSTALIVDTHKKGPDASLIG